MGIIVKNQVKQEDEKRAVPVKESRAVSSSKARYSWAKMGN